MVILILTEAAVGNGWPLWDLVEALKESIASRDIQWEIPLSKHAEIVL